MRGRPAIKEGAQQARAEHAGSGQAQSEQARRAALAGHDFGALSGDPDLEAVVRLATWICVVPMGAVNIITDREQRQLVAVGTPAADCSRADSMCAITIAEPGTVMVPDATADARYNRSPFVAGPLGRVRCYAASPLR